MTSRERMLAALECRPVDHVPCSFMLFGNLRSRCRTDEEFVRRQLEMGLDAYCHTGFLEPSIHPEARESVWVTEEGPRTVYHRRIDTPRGPLTQQVLEAEGWPRSDDFCMFNDWIVPRALEVLVKPEEDLEKLPYLLGPFTDEAIGRLGSSAAAARSFAREEDLLLVGGWCSLSTSPVRDDGVMGADAMSWLSGFEEVCALSLLKPEVVCEYARIIHEWNMRQLEITLDVAAPDLVLRRGWYETTEFWTPGAYREVILPLLTREAELVHEAGSRLGLVTTSAFLPIIDDILCSGIDVLVGLDPKEGKGTDLGAVKGRFHQEGRAIWGGVSGSMTVERGTAEETEEAVAEAIDVLAPGGGFILSPVDNVRDDTELAWTNTERFIEAWRRLR